MTKKRALKDAARDPLIGKRRVVPNSGRRRRPHPAFRIGLAVLMGLFGGWAAGRLWRVL
jgi:hypothetical protein